jgi:hypothetical protein
MKLLETHMMDRLAENGEVYPRTAYALVGPDGLVRRNRITAVLSFLEGASDTPADWISSYVAFVKGLLDDED